jgi:hypothetical protein
MSECAKQSRLIDNKSEGKKVTTVKGSVELALRFS